MGVWSLFIAKALPGMSFCSVLCSGIFRLKRAKAISGILGSNLAQFTCLVVLGKIAGEYWKRSYALMNGIGGVILIVLLIAGAIFIIRRKFPAQPKGADLL